ncbi:anti-sigma B factor antagonist [Streptomyces sp. SA15]|nr:anti-sigma B factor antagonist [Streptomyces sp. SA15]
MHHFHLEPVIAGNDCAALRITGEIDVYTAAKLREQMIDLVDKGVVHIIADMRGVEFLDSTGLGALVGGLKRLLQREGSLKLVINADRIIKIFRITGLTKVFPIYTSVPEAILADPHWRQTVTGEAQSIEDWCRKHSLL